MKNLFGLLPNLKNKLIKDIYFISGPTAVGKSSIALRLAKSINGIIINADSMQVYSNLQILTACPSQEDHKKITHKLYGYVEGSQRYNVAKWCNDISKIIYKNNKKKIYSIIVGGTGMYIDKLLNGLTNIPSVPEEIKYKSKQLLLELGKKNFSDIDWNYNRISNWSFFTKIFITRYYPFINLFNYYFLFYAFNERLYKSKT